MMFFVFHLFRSLFMNNVIVVVGFFQTQEKSVPCATGCCAYSLADQDGIEIKRCKI